MVEPDEATSRSDAETSGTTPGQVTTGQVSRPDANGDGGADAVKVDKSGLTERARHLAAEIVRSYEVVLERVWELGDVLLAAKATLPHGEFQPWVSETGLKRRTAQRYLALRKGYPEMRHLAAFASVDEALRALPTPACGRGPARSRPRAASGEAAPERGAFPGAAAGTPIDDVAAGALEARSAVVSEPIDPASASVGTTEPRNTSAPSEPAVPDAPRPAGPPESSPLPLFDRSDAVEPPEGALRSGDGADSPTETQAVENWPAATGPESGQEPAALADDRGADASPASPPLSPSHDVSGGPSGAHECAGNGQGAARTGDGADLDLARCMEALRASAVRLAGGAGIPEGSRLQAACNLVHTLVAAIEHCLAANQDENVLVAGLPSHVVASLDAQSGPRDRSGSRRLGTEGRCRSRRSGERDITLGRIDEARDLVQS